MNFSTRKISRLETAREKFIRSMRPRSRNSPARKGNRSTLSLSERIYYHRYLILSRGGADRS